MTPVSPSSGCEVVWERGDIRPDGADGESFKQGTARGRPTLCALLDLAHIAFAYTRAALGQAMPPISLRLETMTCASSVYYRRRHAHRQSMPGVSLDRNSLHQHYCTVQIIMSHPPLSPASNHILLDPRAVQCYTIQHHHTQLCQLQPLRYW